MWKIQGNSGDEEGKVDEGQGDEETRENIELSILDEDVDADDVEEDANNTDDHNSCTDNMVGHVKAGAYHWHHGCEGVALHCPFELQVLCFLTSI